jgi:hypothetical protein
LWPSLDGTKVDAPHRQQYHKATLRGVRKHAVARLPGGLQHPILAIGSNALLRDWGRWRLPSEGKGHTFESCRVRQFFLYFIL